MTTFYVDPDATGSNNGTSLLNAWTSCAGPNAHTFSAGDEIRITAGKTVIGPLTIVNSGVAGSYICIGTGRGTTPARVAQSNPATISCANGNGIELPDVEYIWLDNLVISGSGVNTSTGVTTSTGKAVYLSSTQTTNKLRGVRITALTCTGTKDGIWASTATSSQNGYDDLQIWGCDIHACQRVAIIVVSDDGTYASGSTTQNSNIYIGYCQTYDLPGKAGTGACCGEGFTIRNTTTGTMEYCVAHDINIVGDVGIGGGGTTGFDTTVADGITVQYCEAYNILANQTSPSPIDGVGLDFESGSVNCIAQYNYFHDCDGAGFLSGTSIATDNIDNVFRFNMLARNGIKNEADIYNYGGHGAGSGQTVGSHIYGNTVYATHGDAYWADDGGHDYLYNNILISKAGSRCIAGTSSPFVLIGNIYFALGGGTTTVRLSGSDKTTLAEVRATGREAAPYGRFADPLLSDPANAPSTGTLPGANVSTLTYFDLQTSSPARAEVAPYYLLGITPGTLDFHAVTHTLMHDAGAAMWPEVDRASGACGLPVFG